MFLQDIEVNLIITDYCMPGMTGYDLLRKIKESKFLKDIPVVIMSSENVPSRINRYSLKTHSNLQSLQIFSSRIEGFTFWTTCFSVLTWLESWWVLIIRCLDEGAEEFFLKPVQMADVSKLRPHMMRSKAKENQPNKRKGLEEENQSPERTRTKYNNRLEDIQLVV